MKVKSDRTAFASAGWATALAVIVAGGTLGFNVLALRFLPQGQVSLLLSFFAFANLLAFFFSGFQISLMRNIGFSHRLALGIRFDRFSKDLLIIAFGLMLAIITSSPLWNGRLGISPIIIATISVTPIWLALLSIAGSRLNSKGYFALAGAMGLCNIALNLLVQVSVFSVYEVSLEKVLVLHTLVNLAVGSVAFMSIKSEVMTSSLFSPANLRVAALAFIYAFLVQFDLLLSGLLLSVDERANYAAASGLTKSILLFAGVFYLAVFRILINRVKTGEQTTTVVSKGVWAAFAAGAFFSVCGFALGPQLLIFLYGDGWNIASELVPALALAVAPFFVAGVMFQGLLVSPSWRDLISLSLVATLTSICATIFVDTPTDLAFAWLLSGILVVFFLFFARRGSNVGEVVLGLSTSKM